ncbi:MAG TPA: hypothetical protein VFD70_02165 [Anaerolineae bacterium]|nr:hypothetical protein [Anaerolineae bacterium]
MKNKQPSQHVLAQLWQRGVERAAEEQARKQEFDTRDLQEIAGCQIRSGIQAGLEGGKPTIARSLCSLYCDKGC